MLLIMNTDVEIVLFKKAFFCGTLSWIKNDKITDKIQKV